MCGSLYYNMVEGIMTTNDKSAIAEQKAILRALEKGFIVSRPVSPCRYDLVIDDGERLLKVQVKYGDGVAGSEGTIKANLGTVCHGKANLYKEGQVDLLLIYIPKVDKIIALTPDKFCGRPSIIIRYEPSKRYREYDCNLVSDLEW